jgi:hypothetical protein
MRPGARFPHRRYRHRPVQAQEVVMKIVRWAAAVVLTLISIMGIGLAFGGSDTSVAFRVIGPVCGVLGLVAVYGLLRRRHWGVPGALAVCALNVVGGLVDLAVDGTDTAVGLVVSVVALLLTAAAAYSGRTAQPADLPS